MKPYLLPITSVVLQLFAAFWALRLVKVTGRITAWVLIAAAIFFMAVRRMITLFGWFSSQVDIPPIDITFETLGLLISLIMAIGLVKISPLFISMQESRDFFQQRYDLILNSAGEGIFGLDLNGRVSFVNPTAARLTGYDSRELIGRNIHEMLHHTKADGTPHPQEECPIYAALKKGETRIKDNDLFWRKDGSSFPVDYAATPIGPGDGSSSVGAVVVFRDVTERLSLQNQFLQAQKMEAIGNLAGGIAHDFNNLLAAIMGYAEIIMMDFPANQPYHPYLQEIVKVANRGASLTRQLLAFSRKQIMQPRVFNLNEVVAEMDAMLRRLIGEDIDLVTILSPELEGVQADPAQIEQVIMNLAVNARDAMPTGGKLTIETANVHLDEAYAQAHHAVVPGPYVMLAMSDSGSGMDAETKSRIFEPFFTTKELGKGTGLGLATVYGIVKQSGGNIWIYSEPGQGTTFKIYLPRVVGDVESIKSEALPALHLPGSETILVVEDNDNLREVICKTLGKQGYVVLEAANGKDALQIFDNRTWPIDLLLVDVVLPQMSGAEVVKRLQEFDPNLKVLYMSGYTNNAIVHHGVLDTDVAFLQKPFKGTALLLKIRDVLDSSWKMYPPSGV
jgi:PAS domain S-box-containing protein